ncbi:hypothetical protein EV641_108166 [Rhodococcus sp. SMB37]|uniref:hypothetical protein n=1 Tax=Rhodococcus sp. SMB37 TaxID=2512213 RepID=UPI00104C087A|nr:hypothetical protein [Rhodococcus sp. SMB37]TCN52289.1 hypothetical protein EV641_108166 [Rhodococcus sp. SMB37]
MTTSPALLGGTAGVSTAALAVAAHGAAGGSVPTNPAVALLTAVAVGVGIVGAGRPAMSPVALLAAGQLGTHLVLSTLTDGHLHLSVSMLAAHTAAVVGCALLIGIADRLYAACTSVVQHARPWRPTIAAPAVLVPRIDTDPYIVRPLPSCISRRGPPTARFAVS